MLLGPSCREMIADQAEMEAYRAKPFDLFGVEPARLVGRPLHHDPIAQLAIFRPTLGNVAVPGLAAEILKRPKASHPIAREEDSK